MFRARTNRSEFKRLSDEGLYTMVLEKDGEIVSSAMLRFVHQLNFV